MPVLLLVILTNNDTLINEITHPTPHVTRHTSHITRHTSHVTRFPCTRQYLVLMCPHSSTTLVFQLQLQTGPPPSPPPPSVIFLLLVFLLILLFLLLLLLICVFCREMVESDSDIILDAAASGGLTPNNTTNLTLHFLRQCRVSRCGRCVWGNHAH